MKKKGIDVLIIGGDHHNTLSAIRSLARSGCSIEVLFHEDKDLGKIKCAKSKYSRAVSSVVGNNEEAILVWLLSHKKDKKVLVFPCSDLSAYVVDKHFKELEAGYDIPGFLGNPGEVVFLMDKWNQKVFAEENNIPMAKTWNLERTVGEHFLVPEDVVYPCIIKPIVSAQGEKRDIIICKTYKDLSLSLLGLEDKEYDKLLLQEYIQYSKQFLSCGVILQNAKMNIGTLFVKEREVSNGSTALGVVDNHAEVSALNDKILSILMQERYSGQYDIEYFVDDKGVYLNEINFRNSGFSSILTGNGVSTPYYWCMDRLKRQVQYNEVPIHASCMSDLDDLTSNVYRGKLPVKSWFNQLIHTKAHTVFDLSDLSGTFAFYGALFKSYFRKRGR